MLSTNPGDDELAKYVIGVLYDEASPKPEKIDWDDNLIDIGLDSLEGVEAILRFEDDLKIKISDDDCRPVRTVGDMIELVRRKVDERLA